MLVSLGKVVRTQLLCYESKKESGLRRKEAVKDLLHK